MNESPFIFTGISYVITIIVVGYIIKKFFSPPGSRNVDINSKVFSQTYSSQKWSFVAMQYYALILNRTLRVFVTNKYLYGINVGNVIGSPYGQLDSGWDNPNFYIDERKEKRYEKIDPESEDFLRLNTGNFRYLKSDIVGIDKHKTKWGMGRVPYSGRLVIKFKDGHKIELILLGKQNLDDVSKHILNS